MFLFARGVLRQKSVQICITALRVEIVAIDVRASHRGMSTAINVNDEGPHINIYLQECLEFAHGSVLVVCEEIY